MHNALISAFCTLSLGTKPHYLKWKKKANDSRNLELLSFHTLLILLEMGT